MEEKSPVKMGIFVFTGNPVYMTTLLPLCFFKYVLLKFTYTSKKIVEIKIKHTSLVTYEKKYDENKLCCHIYVIWEVPGYSYFIRGATVAEW